MSGDISDGHNLGREVGCWHLVGKGWGGGAAKHPTGAHDTPARKHLAPDVHEPSLGTLVHRSVHFKAFSHSDKDTYSASLYRGGFVLRNHRGLF